MFSTENPREEKHLRYCWGCDEITGILGKNGSWLWVKLDGRAFELALRFVEEKESQLCSDSEGFSGKPPCLLQLFVR